MAYSSMWPSLDCQESGRSALRQSSLRWFATEPVQAARAIKSMEGDRFDLDSHEGIIVVCRGKITRRRRVVSSTVNVHDAGSVGGGVALTSTEQPQWIFSVI